MKKSIRNNSIILLAVSVVVLIVNVIFSVRMILLEQFDQLELRELQQKINVLQREFQVDIDKNKEYFRLMVDMRAAKNTEKQSSEFLDDIFAYKRLEAIHVSGLAILDKNYNLIWDKHDPVTTTKSEIESIYWNIQTSDVQNSLFSPEKNTVDFFTTSDKNLFSVIAMRLPESGGRILYIFIDLESYLKDQFVGLDVGVFVRPLNYEFWPAEDKAQIDLMSKEDNTKYYLHENDRVIALKAFYDDISLRASIVKLTQKRKFSIAIKNFFHKLTITEILIGIVSFLAMLVLFDFLISRKFLHLIQNIQEIEKSKDLTLRLDRPELDELALVADKVNVMLSTIEKKEKSYEVILENIREGIFSIDKHGKLRGAYSNSCDQIFGKIIKNMYFHEIVGIDEKFSSKFISNIFSNKLPFKDMISLGPSEVHVDNKIIKLNYNDILDDNGQMQYLLVVAQDVTSKRKLQKLEEEKNKTNLAVVSILSSVDLFKKAIAEVYELKDITGDLNAFKIAVHNVRAKFVYLNCHMIAECCQRVEDQINAGHEGHPMEYFLAIKSCLEFFLDKNDDILGPTLRKKSGVRLTGIQFNRLVSELKKHLEPDDYEFFIQTLSTEKVNETLSWLDELAQSTAKKLGKKIAPIKWSGDITLNPMPYSSLFNQLAHVINNMVDHGIEFPDERVEAGKSEEGNISFDIDTDGMDIVFTVTDDGAGIDLEKIRKMSEKIHGHEYSQGLTEEELLDLIFYVGFSTKEDVSLFSGRGVGLAGLRSEAEKFNGKVIVRNLEGCGAQFEIRFEKLDLRIAPDFVKSA